MTCKEIIKVINSDSIIREEYDLNNVTFPMEVRMFNAHPCLNIIPTDYFKGNKDRQHRDRIRKRLKRIGFIYNNEDGYYYLGALPVVDLKEISDQLIF